ncbi:MAG: hypothetical protein E7L01_28700, partial [Paenibacillus macerans]|uniref:hypothetical protein n=1 Tax=Paenibacillus macerans TaxID=44252 RepID=UPI0029082506
MLLAYLRMLLAYLRMLLAYLRMLLHNIPAGLPQESIPPALLLLARPFIIISRSSLHYKLQNYCNKQKYYKKISMKPLTK